MNAGSSNLDAAASDTDDESPTQVQSERENTPGAPSFYSDSKFESGFMAKSDVLKIFDPDNLPAKFANYELIELVGQGGAGVVYKARNLSALAKGDHLETRRSPIDRIQIDLTQGDVAQRDSSQTKTDESRLDDSHDENSHDEDWVEVDQLIAVKMIRPEILASPTAVKRFEKESRLHSEVDSPYVTKHLKFGFHSGMYYLASEFVSGVELNHVCNILKRCPVALSLLVIRDLLRALDAMHAIGVIHRDVKPSNLILVFDQEGLEELPEDASPEMIAPVFTSKRFQFAKLTDFGLARHVDQSESMAMTRHRAVLGTPLYMAPEQHLESRTVDHRADIYSVGITLYHMLCGATPFDSASSEELSEMHRFERPKPISLVNPNVGEAVSNIVSRAIEKAPNMRYQTAGEMLADIDAILDGKALRTPSDSVENSLNDKRVKKYEIECELDASVEQLWPLVTDTDRFNRALGLPSPKFTYPPQKESKSTMVSGEEIGWTQAEASFNGMKVRWREFPFQWIFQREMSIRREFESGPFEQVTSKVELFRLARNKTKLIHQFEVIPKGWFGKWITKIQFGIITRRAIKRIYNNIDQILADFQNPFACDVPFDKPIRLNRQQTSALKERTRKLAMDLKNSPLAESFANFLETVADSFAARIRPYVLAEKLECSKDQSVRLCLSAVESGLINMAWDVICPVCRVAATNESSLKNIEEHAHCNACNMQFNVDFGRSVEMIFIVNPEIRSVDQKTYCIGGPYHAPHVIAQNRLADGSDVDIGLQMTEGKYEIRSPQLNQKPQLHVRDNADSSQVDLKLNQGGQPIDLENAISIHELKSGDVCISLKNDHDVDVLVRLEKAPEREQALTAAVASQHPMFKKMFPEQVVNPASLVELSNKYLLMLKHTEADAFIDSAGDIAVQEFWMSIQNIAKRHSASEPSVVECTHEHVVLSFDRLKDLVEAAKRLFDISSDDDYRDAKTFCMAIHCGRVMIGNQANQPRAFGATVRETKRMLDDENGGTLVVHDSLFENDQVSELIDALVALRLDRGAESINPDNPNCVRLQVR